MFFLKAGHGRRGGFAVELELAHLFFLRSSIFPSSRFYCISPGWRWAFARSATIRLKFSPDKFHWMKQKVFGTVKCVDLILVSWKSHPLEMWYWSVEVVRKTTWGYWLNKQLNKWSSTGSGSWELQFWRCSKFLLGFILHFTGTIRGAERIWGRSFHALNCSCKMQTKTRNGFRAP